MMYGTYSNFQMNRIGIPNLERASRIKKKFNVT